MILIKTLNPPYTDQEKENFINKYYSENNIIKQIGNIIEVWQYTSQDNSPVLEPQKPDPTPQEKLRKAKEQKYNEALDGANTFLDLEATFELYNNFHIEATKENMNTFSSVAIAIEKGLLPYQEWTSKEDNVRQLNMEECLSISLGIGQIQSGVWNVQFIAYKNAIETAKTVEEVNAITIKYVNQGASV